MLSGKICVNSRTALRWGKKSTYFNVSAWPEAILANPTRKEYEEMKKKGFTLIELLVVISIIAMLLAILMPALSKVKKIAQRVVCATNLKGLGTAQTVYSQDYEDEYAVQGGRATQAWERGTWGFQNAALNWNNQAQSKTIGASLYLLVREADVSPKSFVCPSGDESEYDGTNDNDLDIIELWDFGNEDLAEGSGFPDEHVSYAYQMPYAPDGGRGQHTADGTKNASFAVMADKNPYLDPKISDSKTAPTPTNWQDLVYRMENHFDGTPPPYSESDFQIKVANAYSHGRDGQNVTYADGHASFEKTTDVGVQNNGIYIMNGGGGGSGDDNSHQVRRGDWVKMTSADAFDLVNLQPENSSDSLLVGDDIIGGHD
jgi:prepilin-type N-terminal cleavage/methylation domain-containing protein